MLSSLWSALWIVTGIQSKFIGYIDRCPDRHGREFRAKVCNYSSQYAYHCSRSDDGKLAETCNRFIQLPSGNFPKYLSVNDRITYDPCPSDRYQQWPVKSYEIAECEMIKSNCEGLGQMPCDNGTTSKDATCSCNYKEGYVTSVSLRCCSPSDTKACHCMYRPCENNSQELNSDYTCVDKCPDGNERKIGESKCSPSINITMSKKSPETTAEFFHDVQPIKQHEVQYIYLSIGIGILLVVLVGAFRLLYLVLGDHDEPFFNAVNSISCVLLISAISYCVVIVVLVNSSFVVDFVLGFLIFSLIYIFVMMFILLTYDLNPERKTVDLQYHVQVYQLLEAAANGNLEKIKRLRDEDYIYLYETDSYERSALHMAAGGGNVAVVDYLLRQKACRLNSVDRWGNTALDYANRFLKNNDDKKEDYINIKNNLTSEKAKNLSLLESNLHNYKGDVANKLIYAARTGNQDTIEKYHKLGTDMDLTDTSGQTALHAVPSKHENVRKYLLDECKVSPFTRWQSKRPEGMEEIQKSIINNKQDFEEVEKPESLSREAKTVLLSQCAARGDIRKLRGFKVAKFDMNQADYDGRTALHVAVSEHQEYIVQFLLQDCSCDIHLVDRWGKRALDEATESGKSDILHIFRRNYNDITDTLSKDYKTFQLINAGAEGNTDKLKRLYKENYYMDLRDYNGRTALHLAAAEGHLDAVQFLVNECKVEKNIPDRDGRTPLKEAQQYYNPDKEEYYNQIKEILQDNQQINQEESLEKQRKVPIKDVNLIYEVNEAAGRGNVNRLEELSHVYMDGGDYLKETPLHVAAAKGQLDAIKHLVEQQKISLFVRNSFWETPLRLAIRKRQYWETKVREILKAGAFHPRLRTDQAKRDKWEDYDGLQSDSDSEINTDVSVKDAAHVHERISNFKKVVEYLRISMRNQIQDKIDEGDRSLSNYNEKEITFLFLHKIFLGDIEAVKRYVKFNRSLVDATDNDQRTALHIAVLESHYHLVIYFLQELNVSTEKKDRWNNTPLDCAKQNGDNKMVKIINNYGRQ